MELIFNDLLFESPEAQAEFLAYERACDPTEAEKLRSVLGKPSQFVGRVMSLSSAKMHWQQWAQWQATEGAALEAATHRVEARNRASSEEIQAARTAWHEAVEWGKQNEREWDAWLIAEIGKLRAMHANAAEARKKHITEARFKYRVARGK